MTDTPDTPDPNAAPPDYSAVPGPHWDSSGEPLPGNPLLTPGHTEGATPQMPDPEFVEYPDEGAVATPGEPIAPLTTPPFADQPAAATPQPTGQAPAETPASVTIPGAGDSLTVSGSVPAPPLHPAVAGQINAIEQLALFWGGDTGTKIRNHIGRLRELLKLV